MSSDENFDWIQELFEENFLATYDVIVDIRKRLQISDKVIIPIFNPTTKFHEHFPYYTFEKKKRYCSFRSDATKILERNGVIKSYKIKKDFDFRNVTITIELNKAHLEKVYELFEAEYQLRYPALSSDEQTSPIPTTLQDSVEAIRRIINKFHQVANQLRDRRNNRPTLKISDEYDVQDLLHALLHLFFTDIRKESYTPNYAGKSSRVDFHIKPEGIAIETKKTKRGRAEKEIGDEIIIDIERYSQMSDCSTAIFFIYDPSHIIRNYECLEKDLGGERDRLTVEVIIVPKSYRDN